MTLVARVWPGSRFRPLAPLSHSAIYLGRNLGAGDGNRTRMTSLEGFECGGAEQRERRSDNVPVCPSVTVNPFGSLSYRLRTSKTTSRSTKPS
jgi:hypothetical protein